MRKLLIILILQIGFIAAVNAQIQKDKVIDRVVAKVGNNIILQSSVEDLYNQYISQGQIGTDLLKCQILEEMLFQKLLLSQAQVDSVKITDAQIENELDKRIRYFVAQVGSKEKLEEFYKKSIIQLKAEYRPIVKEQLQINNVQSKITENIKITPSEVKTFFNSIPSDSIPLVGSEIEIAQIVKQPPISEIEKQEVRVKLDKLRERILKGEDFSALAVLYSEDPGSSKNGGELGFYPRGELYPEFEAVAFNLKPGEVSNIIESKAGFHIIQMIERRGEEVNVRHILLIPKVSPLELDKARLYLDSIANLIRKDSVTFSAAAAKFSDDINTKMSGGLMINRVSGNSHFDPKDVEPSLFFSVDKMKPGEVSKPLYMKTDDGKQAYRIVLLKSRIEPHKANLKDDYQLVQEQALNSKKSKAISEWINTKKSNFYIDINNDYKNCKFTHNWNN
ncbi:MAG: peptidylprolyl isomerase [Bacteroidota bacterium]|nr:peptidylprolyl isomerase [Bacteroidota bacterium]